MQNPAERRAFWQLQFCVFLWGFTAILGKLITLSATPLVVWRMALSTVMLALLPSAVAGLRRLERRAVLRHSLAGAVIALHWLTFYASIKLANASVAVACLALGAVFAAMIEPLVTGRRHERSELLLGVAAIPGVLLLIGGVPQGMLTGVLVGIVSAALTALFSSMNRRFINQDEDPGMVSLLQLGTGTLFLAAAGTLIFGPAETLLVPQASDFGWLLLLAAVCTVLPFILWLRTLHHINAFGTQLALNMEPVYAIILAALLFSEHEELTPTFYLGAVIILATVFLQPWLNRRRTERRPTD